MEFLKSPFYNYHGNWFGQGVIHFAKIIRWKFDEQADNTCKGKIDKFTDEKIGKFPKWSEFLSPTIGQTEIRCWYTEEDCISIICPEFGDCMLWQVDT